MTVFEWVYEKWTHYFGWKCAACCEWVRDPRSTVIVGGIDGDNFKAEDICMSCANLFDEMAKEDESNDEFEGRDQIIDKSV